MRNFKQSSPWLIAGIFTLVGIIQVIFAFQAAVALPNYIELFVFVLINAMIAFVGALIVDRKPGNRIGWLMLAVAGVTALPVFYDTAFLDVFLPAAPSTLSPGIWLTLWLHGWFWLLQLIPIFHIVLRFPTGDLFSRRWIWINRVTLGTVLFAAFVAMFPDQIGPLDRTWTLANPVGFLSREAADGLSLLWVIGLLTLAIGSLTSIITRFRRGQGAIRQQIKWLLYAGALLAMFTVFSLIYFSIYSTSPVWLNIIAYLVLLTPPLAIANAILRHRLWDIDLIIRRTLQYALLTGLLALIYFGGIVMLQNVFGGLLGDTESPLITVISTLAIAALFNPLRGRIQDFIDRRFFRSKYDAEKALIEFAAVARDEVDMVRLSGSLLSVVESTMQPEQTSLWLRDNAIGK